MAEGGVMGAIGALTNAVNDALGPYGVVADRQPLRPDYIRELLRSSRGVVTASGQAAATHPVEAA